jgi:hypothetical protein
MPSLPAIALISPIDRGDLDRTEETSAFISPETVINRENSEV